MPKTSNIYIFFGEDEFSLRQKVNFWKSEFAKKFTINSIDEINSLSLSETDLCKRLEQIITPSLFSIKKLIIARNCLPAKANQDILARTLQGIVKEIPTDYFLIFWQDTFDRRLSFNKNLAKEVNLVEFHLPHGLELNSWIHNQAQALGLNMDRESLEKLAVFSGRDLFEEKKVAGRVVDRKEFYDLWQINSELHKLHAYSDTITVNDIINLVSAKLSENVFALSDAVVSQNKPAALEILENLTREENMDEKSITVKLLGLISEQVRSLLIVGMLKDQNMDQKQIADFLGWSPGRVFVTLRNSAGINKQKLKTLLSRLLEADAIIKSTDTNPKLLVDMLIVK